MTIHTDPDRQHAVYSPSSAHRWSVCTASAEAIDRLPEQEEGDAAKEGTQAHEELERVLAGAAPDPDHPAAYAVALAVSYVKQLPPGKLWIEQRVALTPEIWGRCDVCHWDPATECVTILDLKNGFVDVPVEDNEQLLIYAAGSIFTHKLPAKWVRLVVVQPNSIVPGPRVKQFVTDTNNLHAFATRLAIIPGGPKEFKTGEQCRYCPLFGRCPASRDVLANLSAVFCHAPGEVPDAQYAIFKACEKPIADFYKAADKEATKRALTGKPPTGTILVTATTRRDWKDPAAARKIVVEKCGVDALDPPTPAQAEKLGIDVSELAVAPPGGPVLAFESDKRKPWAPPSAAEMFAGVKLP